MSWRWRDLRPGVYFCPIEGAEVQVRKTGAPHGSRRKAEVRRGGQVLAKASGRTRGDAAWNAVHRWERPTPGRTR